ARHIADGIADALKTLILDELLGEHRDRLRNVDDGCVGLGAGRGPSPQIADRSCTATLNMQISWCRLGRRRSRPGCGGCRRLARAARRAARNVYVDRRKRYTWLGRWLCGCPS